MARRETVHAGPRRAAPANLVFVVGLLLVLGLLSLLLFLPFLTSILLGLLIVYLTFPLFRAIARRTKRPRLAASIVLVLVFVSVLVPLGYLSYLLFGEAQAFAASLDAGGVSAGIDGAVRSALGAVGVEPAANHSYGKQLVDAALPAAQQYLQNNLPNILATVTAFFVGLFILAFVVFYGLLDGPALVDYLQSVLPLSHRQSSALIAEVEKTIDAVFLGQIVGAVLQGALGALGFLLFGVPGVLLWGLVMTILSVIPFLGAFLVWGPAAVWLLATGETWQGVALLAWGAVLVSNVDNVVKPLLVGSRARIHPVVVLVGVLGGLLVFGVMGFVLGPLVVSLFIAVLNFWRTDYLPAYRKQNWREALEDAIREESDAPEAPEGPAESEGGGEPPP